MAKRLILTALLVASAALATWLAPGLFQKRPADAPAGSTSGLANPPISGSVADFTPSSPARPAPAATFSDAEGGTVALEDFAGRLVLLNFWATWCGPCVEELPSLDRLQGSAGDARFVVLAVSIDRNGLAAAKPFYAKHAINNLGLYLDARGEAARAFMVQGLPFTILIGPDGAVLGTIEGPAVWDSPEALALIGFYRDRSFPAKSAP